MTSSRYIVHGLIERRAAAEILDAVAVGPSGIERRVLLKRATSPGDEPTRQSFFDEAQVLARLEHPNIVRLLDAGVIEGRAFQVLDFVAGLDLAKVVERCRLTASFLPPGLALHIVGEVASALDHAHTLDDLGIVHRDVTPSNILVSWDGSVLLSDFGIALFQDRSSSTQIGFVKGKLGYMSPEQMMRSNVDARSDLFSLGCVLHELLTGATPLASEASRQRLLLGEPIELSGALDPSVRPIVEKLLARDRRHRYRDAAEVVAACQAASAAPRGGWSRSLAGWLSELVSASEPTRVETTFGTESFELTLDTQSGTYRDFTRTDADETTRSRVSSFLEDTTRSSERAPVLFGAAQTVPRDSKSRDSSAPPGGRWRMPLLSSAIALLAIGAVIALAQRTRPSPVPRPTVAPPIVAVPKPSDAPGPKPRASSADLPSVISPPGPTESASTARVEPKDESADEPEVERARKSRRAKPSRPNRSRKSSRTEPLAEASSDEPSSPTTSRLEKSIDLEDALRRLATELRSAQGAGVEPAKLRALESSYLDLSSVARSISSDRERAELRKKVDRVRNQIHQLHPH